MNRPSHAVRAMVGSYPHGRELDKARYVRDRQCVCVAMDNELIAYAAHMTQVAWCTRARRTTHVGVTCTAHHALTKPSQHAASRCIVAHIADFASRAHPRALVRQPTITEKRAHAHHIRTMTEKMNCVKIKRGEDTRLVLWTEQKLRFGHHGLDGPDYVSRHDK